MSLCMSICRALDPLMTMFSCCCSVCDSSTLLFASDSFSSNSLAARAAAAVPIAPVATAPTLLVLLLLLATVTGGVDRNLEGAANSGLWCRLSGNVVTNCGGGITIGCGMLGVTPVITPGAVAAN